MFGGGALFIVTIWNPYHWYSETRQQLVEILGCRRIAPPSAVYWRFAETLPSLLRPRTCHTECAQAS